VLLFNDQGELLLQKRSADKYHSASLWTNTCCSHPRPGERTQDAAQRRLKEEMGIDVLPDFAYKFQYQVQLENGLIEHELDHVLVGTFNDEPAINHREVEDWKFVSLEKLRSEVAENPGAYTHWFKLILSHPELKVALPQ
jgi:isopentenyl-diphosphate delta-isomerase